MRLLLSKPPRASPDPPAVGPSYAGEGAARPVAGPHRIRMEARAATPANTACPMERASRPAPSSHSLRTREACGHSPALPPVSRSSRNSTVKLRSCFVLGSIEIRCGAGSCLRRESRRGRNLPWRGAGVIIDLPGTSFALDAELLLDAAIADADVPNEHSHEPRWEVFTVLLARSKRPIGPPASSEGRPTNEASYEDAACATFDQGETRESTGAGSGTREDCARYYIASRGPWPRFA